MWWWRKAVVLADTTAQAVLVGQGDCFQLRGQLNVFKVGNFGVNEDGGVGEAKKMCNRAGREVRVDRQDAVSERDQGQSNG